MKTTIARISTVLAVLALLPAPASAQLPQASAATPGLGGNVTASARGFSAVANNPAGLGHPSSPGFSLAIPALSWEVGIGPIKLSELADWEGMVIPDATKLDWLDRVRTSGSQAGALGVGATPFAMNVGSVGFQLSVIAAGETNLAPDVAELLLFGNAGRTGTPGDFDLSGSTLDAFVLTTAAVSTGFRATPRLYLGVTGKYTVGNALLVGRDMGSTATGDPLAVEVQFPLLVPRDEDPSLNNGSGIGLDLGALWEGPTMTIGATIQNIFHTLEWKVDDMSYIPGEAFFDQDTTTDNFDEQPASTAPASLLEVVEGRTIKPVFSAGLEFHPSSLLSVTADIRKRVSGGLEFGPDFHAGVGAELHALGFLPLRAHAGVVSGGMQIGGGASLVLGPVNLTGAGAYRTGDAEDAVLGMLTLSFGAN